MIYVLFGNDTKNKSTYIKELVHGGEIFFISSTVLNKEMLLSYSTNISLFGDSPIVVVENILSENEISLSSEDLSSLKESKTIFIFKEDKLTALDQKKYKKYAEVKGFEDKKSITTQKFNVFSITDSFASKDKIGTWVLYNKAIESGIEPEAIAGILFWKIKTMILSSNKFFTKNELKTQSSNIISLYHRAHRGDSDFIVGLEQFILSSLSSK